MRDLAELNVLLRANTELPDGLRPTTDEFREGWNRIRNGNAIGLEKRIKAHKWHLIRIAKSITASGTGISPKQAVARAFDHAVAVAGVELNALEVAGIQSTEYPWFWLARIRVHTYRIQQDEMPVMRDASQDVPSIAARELIVAYSHEMNQNFADRVARQYAKPSFRSGF